MADEIRHTRSVCVRQVEVSQSARDLATLARVDYEDSFLLDVGSARDDSGEDWARAVLEGAPAELRKRLRWGWTALGLKRDRSPSSVLGWSLRHSDGEFALLGAESRIGMPAELLLRPEGGELRFATFVEQRNAAARMLWELIGPRHRRVVPYLLDRAGRRSSESVVI
jgi:hypothetical protein